MCGSGVKKYANEALSIATQVGTAGTMDFDDGKIVAGPTSTLLAETAESAGGFLEKSVKDITGATAAEEANKAAAKQLEIEKAAALQDVENAKAQTAVEQLALSRSASSRTKSRGTSRGTSGSRYSNLGGEEQDFLGL